MNIILLVIVVFSFAILYLANRKFSVTVGNSIISVNLLHRTVKIPIGEITDIKYSTRTDFYIPFVIYDDAVVVKWNSRWYPIVLGKFDKFSQSDIALITTIITTNSKVCISQNLEKLISWRR